MAALFNPRFYSQPEPNFRGLFRLLEDFDQYSSENDNKNAKATQFFTPKFDLKETQETYELHGELPWLHKENVTVEFTDPQTIVVRGKVERSHTSSSPKALLGKTNEASEAIEDSKQTPADDEVVTKPHKVTIQDEGEENETSSAPQSIDNKTTDLAKSNEVTKPSEPAVKYWVSERSVGQFSRTFHFPSRVDHDAVSAALDNGILTVSVPKAKKHESRRIAIN